LEFSGETIYELDDHSNNTTNHSANSDQDEDEYTIAPNNVRKFASSSMGEIATINKSQIQQQQQQQQQGSNIVELDDDFELDKKASMTTRRQAVGRQNGTSQILEEEEIETINRNKNTRSFGAKNRECLIVEHEENADNDGDDNDTMPVAKRLKSDADNKQFVLVSNSNSTIGQNSMMNIDNNFNSDLKVSIKLYLDYKNYGSTF
jgi:hypothetical protein